MSEVDLNGRTWRRGVDKSLAELDTKMAVVVERVSNQDSRLGQIADELRKMRGAFYGFGFLITAGIAVQVFVK